MIVIVSGTPALSIELLMIIYHQNTQSGSQWDGLRHFGIFGGHNVFYNKYVSEVRISRNRSCLINDWINRSTPAASFSRGHFFISDPEELEKNKHKIKLGIHSTPNIMICATTQAHSESRLGKTWHLRPRCPTRSSQLLYRRWQETSAVRSLDDPRNTRKGPRGMR